MGNDHVVFISDAISALENIPSESVQLVVTSPPYWTIKDYDAEGQIGFRQSYSAYLSDLTEIWRSLYEKLSPGCKIAINVGDQYLRAADNNGKYQIVPIAADIIASCIAFGFTFLGNIIWKKISTTKASGGGSWMGSIYFPRDGYITYEHEYIIIIKKEGKAPSPSQEQKEKSKLTKHERSKWFRGIWDDVPPTRQVDHVAMFPIELPTRLIKMFSFYGETVLDPFLGSGTTAAAAQKCGRKSIGIEINASNVALIKEKIENPTVVFLSEKNIERKVSEIHHNKEAVAYR